MAVLVRNTCDTSNSEAFPEGPFVVYNGIRGFCIVASYCDGNRLYCPHDSIQKFCRDSGKVKLAIVKSFLFPSFKEAQPLCDFLNYLVKGGKIQRGGDNDLIITQDSV